MFKIFSLDSSDYGDIVSIIMFAYMRGVKGVKKADVPDSSSCHIRVCQNFYTTDEIHYI